MIFKQNTYHISAMNYFGVGGKFSEQLFVQTDTSQIYFVCYMPGLKEFKIFDMRKLKKPVIFKRTFEAARLKIHKSVNQYKPGFDHKRVLFQEDGMLTVVDLEQCKEIARYVTDFYVRKRHVSLTHAKMLYRYPSSKSPL